VVTARDEVAGETPGALRAEAVAPREARAAEAVGVAIAARVAIVAIVAIVACGLRCDAEDSLRYANTWLERFASWQFARTRRTGETAVGRKSRRKTS
jgi:hypothetical protein